MKTAVFFLFFTRTKAASLEKANLEVLFQKDGQVVSEVLTFEKEGRGHSHDLWETCYLTQGSGIIVNGDQQVNAGKGSVCKVPPNTIHWMKPDPYLEILLVYSEKS